jgi:hypothetical protein
MCSEPSNHFWVSLFLLRRSQESAPPKGHIEMQNAPQKNAARTRAGSRGSTDGGTEVQVCLNLQTKTEPLIGRTCVDFEEI